MNAIVLQEMKWRTARLEVIKVKSKTGKRMEKVFIAVDILTLYYFHH